MAQTDAKYALVRC